MEDGQELCVVNEEDVRARKRALSSERGAESGIAARLRLETRTWTSGHSHRSEASGGREPGAGSRPPFGARLASRWPSDGRQRTEDTCRWCVATGAA